MSGMQVKPIGMFLFDAASLTVNYQEINGTGFSHPVNLLRIINNCKLPIWISYDGTNDHDFIRNGSDAQLDWLKGPSINFPGFQKNLKVYVKSGAASVGHIVIAGYTLNY